MRKEFVLTITAANRTGILAAVSNAIAELGGDIREMSVNVISRFFTIIVAADFPEHREPGVINDHLRDIGRPYGLEVVVKDPDQEQLQLESPDESATFYLTLSGRNQTGMVRRIASRLAQDGIDISDVYAVRDGESAFRMILELAVPDGINCAGLVTDIQQLPDAAITAQLQTAEEFQVAGSARPLRAILS